MTNDHRIETSSGTVVVTWNDRGLLTSLRWLDLDSCEPSRNLSFLTASLPPGALLELLDRITGYFDRGEPIGEIPWELIDRSGWSEFQESVYRVTGLIPHGETRPYAWVAARLDRALAVRAVGQALKKNPLPVLVPCHRVVSSHGGLGGFMGKRGPADPEILLKKKLLEIEETYLNPMFPFLTSEEGFLAG